MGSEARFFVDDEPALAARLENFLARLAADLDAQTWRSGAVTLVLAGGCFPRRRCCAIWRCICGTD
jgi:hypothetical protein